ncbi:MAG: OsmC family protein [Pseudomonadota bacterium]
MTDHQFAARITWTGNKGEGTAGYRAYARDHEIAIDGKPAIMGSSDPAFRGDPARHNPEDLLIASLSACHMLWFLHLAAEAGLVVETYTDDATGAMVMEKSGAGQFREVILRPRVEISAGDARLAPALHEKAHNLCFIARSVNFPVRCEGEISLQKG